MIALLSNLMDSPAFQEMWIRMDEEEREDFQEILSGAVEEKILARERTILLKLSKDIECTTR